MNMSHAAALFPLGCLASVVALAADRTELEQIRNVYLLPMTPA
jgi:hypothetical protein